MTCAEVRDLAPAYVLGALEWRELEAVRAHLATCPEVHEELAELGSIAIALVESVELVEPPVSLRDRVMAAARQDLEARGASATAPAPATAPSAVAPPRRAVDAAPEPARPSLWQRIFGPSPGVFAMRAVAVIAVLALVGWNFTLQNELAGTRSYQARVDQALALARQPGSQVAFLSPTGAAGDVKGIAVMPASGTGLMVLTGLRPTTGDQAYVAWAILEGAAPVPVGGFRVGADGVGYFDDMPAAGTEPVTVAVTLEPSAAATAPTTDPVTVGVAQPPAAG